MVKHIILCADDYSQNQAVSQGIINLIAQKRLSATSCLVNTNYWPTHAEWLKPYQRQVDIGLHFNLTEGTPLSNMPTFASNGRFPSLNTLLFDTHLRKVNYKEILAELNQQLDAFENAMGVPPDFIDGHQHIHCLPIIQNAILAIYTERLKRHDCWIRNIISADFKQLLHQPAAAKKLILYVIGGKKFQRKLLKYQISHNSSFDGIYNFNHHQHYKNLFPIFINAVDNYGLIMCHPGLDSTDTKDPIYLNRAHEYHYFSSEQYLIDCQNYSIKLGRFKPT